MECLKNFNDNQLSFRLSPLHYRELFYLTDLPCDVYYIKNGGYEIYLEKHTPITKKLLVTLMESPHLKLFVDRENHNFIIEAQQNNLRTITRSLSIGDSLNKCRKQLSLLTLNMRYLYDDPTNDAALNLQFQAVKNLGTFLLDNPDTHYQLYSDFIKTNQHYIFAQPLISSIFLIGFLKLGHQFSPKEIETLFITSYFKDIGMSALATEKYDQMELSEADKKILLSHPQISIQILQGRVPLGPSYLKIIEHHHVSSLLKDNHHLTSVSESDDPSTAIEPIERKKTLYGLETVAITTLDIVAAMITGRPYRNPTNLFDALELTKKIIADEYPQEFKLIVSYFKQFFRPT